jgi:ABC-type ATPase involved in cell division
MLLVPELSYDNNDVDQQRNEFLKFGGTEGTVPSTLMPTIFSLKQFSKTMGLLNNCVFNKLKKVDVAWLQEKLNLGIMLEQHNLTHHQDG